MINPDYDHELEKIAKRYKGTWYGCGTTLRSGVRDISFGVPSRSKAIRLVNAFKRSKLVCYAHWMYVNDGAYSVWVYYQGQWVWRSFTNKLLTAEQFKRMMRQEYR